MKSVEDMDVYKIAFQLILDVYRATEHFPREEMFGLVSQMRRAVISITSNLSEGAARGSMGDYKRFASIARGSAAELKCQLKIAGALGFIKDDESADLYNAVDRVCQMLTKLINKIEIRITDNG